VWDFSHLPEGKIVLGRPGVDGKVDIAIDSEEIRC
jgi:hypothetical protein